MEITSLVTTPTERLENLVAIGNGEEVIEFASFQLTENLVNCLSLSLSELIFSMPVAN